MELIIGASYPAKRSGAIAVGESEKGALMCYIPFMLTGGIAFTGNHSVCIGTKDGTLQERAIEGLREIFGWKTENPFDLQRIEIPEGDSPEFVLADYHNEPYTNKKGEEINSYKFRWLNKVGSGLTPATPDDESAAMAKWGAKFSTAPSTPKEKPTPTKSSPSNKMPATPKRTLAKAETKPARVLTAETLLSLIAKKQGVDENDQDAMNTFGNDVYFPLTDKLFGNGVMPETPEQFEQVAKEFGV